MRARVDAGQRQAETPMAHAGDHAAAAPEAVTQAAPSPAMALHRAVGNQAYGKLLQTQLRIGPARDAHEERADRAADAVVRRFGPIRVPSLGGLGGESRAAAPSQGALRATAPSIVHDTLREPGHPLDPATRERMENGFGHPFGDVRVHSDGGAARSARAIDALAYTVGSDVVFAEGRYSPHTHDGAWLLAHELAHVAQGPAGGEPVIRRQTTFFGPTQGAPPDWDKKVAAATAPADRAALVKTATGLNVNDATAASAKDASPTAANLTEYTDAGKTINYDDGLNAKTSPVNSRSLARNAGYTLQAGGKYYIILGPKALDPTRFFETVTILSHEFDHVRQGVAGSALKGDESEVDAWTSSFIRDFHRTYLLGDTGSTCYVQSVATFTPLLDYYSHTGVSQAQRDSAAKRIAAYYQATLSVHAGHTAAFKFWVHRSMKSVSATPNLADRLNTDLSLGITASDSLATTRQFPCGSLKSLAYTGATLDKATLSPATPTPTPTTTPATKPPPKP